MIITNTVKERNQIFVLLDKNDEIILTDAQTFAFQSQYSASLALSAYLRSRSIFICSNIFTEDAKILLDKGHILRTAFGTYFYKINEEIRSYDTLAGLRADIVNEQIIRYKVLRVN